MKFGKKYTSFMETEAQRLLPECTCVEFKRLKKLLKKCPLHDPSNAPSSSASSSARHLDSDSECENSEGSDFDACPETTISSLVATKPSSCSTCDEQFFPDLLKALSAVVVCFNARAQELLRLHLATGFTKYIIRLRTKIPRDRVNMIQLGHILVYYGCMNALAVRKILKKYDKVHGSLNGREFKTRLQGMRAELLQSPWLIELGALAVNLIDHPKVPRSLVLPNQVKSIYFDRNRQTLSCVLPDSARLDFNLTCPICLDIVFDPVALGCGHIFCTSCVCAAASVPAFQGPKVGHRRCKCPLCRQAGVYPQSVHLRELSTLIATRCEEYYSERLPIERVQRLKEAKEYWNRLLAL